MDFDYSFGVPVAIVQSDSTIIAPRLKGLYVTATGAVKVKSKGVDATINITSAPVVLPFGNITQVFDTGTSIADADLWGIR